MENVKRLLNLQWSEEETDMAVLQSDLKKKMEHGVGGTCVVLGLASMKFQTLFVSGRLEVMNDCLEGEQTES